MADGGSAKAWIKSLGDVNKPDALGRTPLQAVASDMDARYTRALLKAGADVKAKAKNDWPALMTAACYGTAEVVQLLIDAGADINARDVDCGKTVLMWAAGGLRERKAKVQALIKAGADPKTTSKTGWNALMSAASSGDVAAVELLLKAGLDPNARTTNGETALMMAAGQSKDKEVLKVLLNAAANVSAQDYRNRTPLMYAAAQGTAENIKALLSGGADLNARDKWGKTALDLASSSVYNDAAIRVSVLKAAASRKMRE